FPSDGVVIEPSAAEKEASASVICVPLDFGGAVVGTLTVTGRASNAFQAPELKILESLAEGLPETIEVARSTEVLFRSSAEMLHAQTLPDLLNGLVHLTRELMREPVCLLWLFNKSRNAFTLEAEAVPSDCTVDRESFVIPENALPAKYRSSR